MEVELNDDAKFAIHRYLGRILIAGAFVVTLLAGSIGYFVTTIIDQMTSNTERLIERTDRLIEKLEKEMPGRVERVAREEAGRNIQDYLEDARELLAETRIVTVAAEVELKRAQKMQRRQEKVLREIETFSDKVRTDVEDAKTVVSELRKQVDAIRFAEDTASTEQKSDNLISLRDDIEDLNSQFAKVREELASMPALGPPDPESPGGTLETAVENAIYVRQLAREAESPDPTDKRRWFELTFSIFINEASGVSTDEVMGRIEKVVYKFDPRWFTPSAVTRLNRGGKFSMSKRVWGRTGVSVDIYMRGLDRIIERKGYINLDKTVCFTGDPSNTDCT